MCHPRSKSTLVITIAVAGWLVSAAAGAPPNHPNVLFLLTDDQRPDTVHALGNAIIRTPSLDGLVKGGTAFVRAVSPNPLCVPSRAEILTGCTGFRNGIFPDYSSRLNPRLTLWPEAMRAAGYHSWYVGKWHTDGRPTTRGYEESQALFVGGRGPAPRQFDAQGREITGYAGWVFQDDSGHEFPEKGIGLSADINSRFADAAIAFITRKPDRPFFLHVNFTGPHDPLILPPGYAGKYVPERMPLPANFLPRHPFEHGNLSGRDELILPTPRTPEAIRAELALYYAVIEHLDFQVGRILRALDASGQAENTIIVFTSDHGLAIGSHGLRGKQNMYEHTVGVPLLMKGPGIPRGARLGVQVYLRDLFPTLCELVGLAVPDTVEGKSLVSVIQGKAKSVYPEVFGYFRDVQRMIRGERWKLIWYPKIGRYQLFDLQADPGELHDLSARPELEPVRVELRGKLEAWQKQVHDPLVAK